MNIILSIIIPVFNEEETIGSLLSFLEVHAGPDHDYEIIIVDGGSTDNTIDIAGKFPVKVIKCPARGRSIQMNEGARSAGGELLYFLHADTFPPEDFLREITQAYQSGISAGCFRLRFDDTHPLLKMYGWFTRFDVPAFRFGDQSLFIEKKLFFEIGSFRENLIIMEDNEIVGRIQDSTRFIILSQYVTTSARKYRNNGVIRLQLIFTLIYILFHAGVSQKGLVKIYRTFIKN